MNKHRCLRGLFCVENLPHFRNLLTHRLKSNRFWERPLEIVTRLASEEKSANFEITHKMENRVFFPTFPQQMGGWKKALEWPYFPPTQIYSVIYLPNDLEFAISSTLIPEHIFVC